MAVTSSDEQVAVAFPAALKSYLVRRQDAVCFCVAMPFILVLWESATDPHKSKTDALNFIVFGLWLILMLMVWIVKRNSEWRYIIKHEFHNLKHEMPVVQWQGASSFTAGVWTLNLPLDKILSLEPAHWRDLPALRIEYRSGGWSPKRRTAWIIFEETDRLVVETQIVPFLSQYGMAEWRG